MTSPATSGRLQIQFMFWSQFFDNGSTDSEKVYSQLLHNYFRLVTCAILGRQFKSNACKNCTCNHSFRLSPFLPQTDGRRIDGFPRNNSLAFRLEVVNIVGVCYGSRQTTVCHIVLLIWSGYTCQTMISLSWPIPIALSVCMSVVCRNVHCR